MTYDEARKIAYQDFDDSKKRGRVYEIFNSDSETNRCLRRHVKLLTEHSPNIEEELEKWGFLKTDDISNPGWFTPGHEVWFANDKGDEIYWGSDFIIIVKFNDKEKSFDITDVIGEAERNALKWLKEQLDDNQ